MCNTKSSPCNNLIHPKGLPKSAQSPLLDQPVLCRCCCACMFMAAFSALLQPLFSQPPPLSHCLHHPQHSHHHGQLLQPPKSWPNSPHTLFFSCWATGCFFGHFTRRRLPFTATHKLWRPPPTMDCHHQASPCPVSAPWTCEERYKIFPWFWNLLSFWIYFSYDYCYLDQK